MLLWTTLSSLPRHYLFHLRGEFEVQQLHSAPLSARVLPRPGDTNPGGDKRRGTTPPRMAQSPYNVSRKVSFFYDRYGDKPLSSVPGSASS